MIIWLEDDWDWIEAYQSEIEHAANDNVKAVDNTDELFDFLDQMDNSSTINLIIVDIQMATGKSISKEKSNGGTKTGELVIGRLRSEYNISIPILIWSIKDDRDLEELSEADDYSFYFKKTDSYEEVLKKIREIYAG
jgi:hypothetical protein